MKEYFSDLWLDIQKNKGAVAGLLFVLLFMILAIIAPLISVYAPDQVIEGALRLPPGSRFQEHFFILGTDDIGRDLWSRLLYGARVSLLVGLSVVFISAGSKLLKSNLSCSATFFHQAIISARCMASRPNFSDFSAGWKSDLSNGTHSKYRLVTSASRLNS